MGIKILEKDGIEIVAQNGFIGRLTVNGIGNYVHGGSLDKLYQTTQDKQRIREGAPEYSNIINLLLFENKNGHAQRKKSIPMDLPFTERSTKEKATFEQEYKAGKLITPEKGEPYRLPHTFTIEASHEIEENPTTIRSTYLLINRGQTTMRYQFSISPIFTRPPNAKSIIIMTEDEKDIPLEKIVQEKDNTLSVEGRQIKIFYCIEKFPMTLYLPETEKIEIRAPANSGNTFSIKPITKMSTLKPERWEFFSMDTSFDDED